MLLALVSHRANFFRYLFFKIETKNSYLAIFVSLLSSMSMFLQIFATIVPSGIGMNHTNYWKIGTSKEDDWNSPKIFWIQKVRIFSKTNNKPSVNSCIQGWSECHTFSSKYLLAWYVEAGGVL